MIVKDLIERLKKCDQDLQVFAGYATDNPITDVTLVENILQITLSDNEDEPNSVVLRLGN